MACLPGRYMSGKWADDVPLWERSILKLIEEQMGDLAIHTIRETLYIIVSGDSIEQSSDIIELQDSGFVLKLTVADVKTLQ